jgi:selenocysteine lyase/cysteine desulfurase
MSVTRRNFLVGSSLSVAAGALTPLLAEAKETKMAAPARYDDWASVRREFDLAPDYTHLGLFYLTSHPRPVREAIEKYRRQLDANPFVTVESSLFESAEKNMPLKTCSTIAGYIGADPQDIALTQNTTTGLSLIYHGLALREGDEVLTTNHDHYVHHESIRLATSRCGASWRKIPLWDSYNTIAADEIVDRIHKGIGPKTRVVGVTWVHSASGVRLPIRRIADVIAEVNSRRDEKDRVLLIVDGVHGIGVEDPKIVAMGCDAFSAGTHKWIFGPRGTGFVWAKPGVWARMRPLIPTFYANEVFEAWGEEKEPDHPPRAAWFSPGGFQAFEHHWALPEAFRFHESIGPARITARIHELNRQMKEGLAAMPQVQLYTPRDENLSAGMACFDVKGMKQVEVVSRLLEQKIIASTTPYRISYARLSCGIVNTPEEVEKTLGAIHRLT